MRIFFFSLFASIIILCGGCKNDLDLIDNYHSTIVCYGLLDPADTVHYVRVSKIFLGEGNAVVMAQNPDSIGFPIGSIQVTIEEWKNGLMMQNYSLSADTTIPRDSGVFENPNQIIYRGKFPVLKDGSTYKLKVLDLVKGTSIYSETPIVQDIAMTDPYSTLVPLNLYDTTTIRFKWKSGAFGLRYNLKVRFHYTEQFLSDTTQVSQHFVDWQLGELDALSASGNESMYLSTRRDNFLRMVSQKIPQNVEVRRIAGNLDFIFIGAAEDLVSYIDVTNANNNSATSIPPFSNIHNGLGLFSSRTTNDLTGYSIDAGTRYQLRVNPITYGLNFVR